MGMKTRRRRSVNKLRTVTIDVDCPGGVRVGCVVRARALVALGRVKPLTHDNAVDMKLASM